MNGSIDTGTLHADRTHSTWIHGTVGPTAGGLRTSSKTNISVKKHDSLSGDKTHRSEEEEGSYSKVNWVITLEA